MLDEPGCCYTGGGELYAAWQVVKFAVSVGLVWGLGALVWWLGKR